MDVVKLVGDNSQLGNLTMAKIIHCLKPGDLVTIVTKTGHERTGKFVVENGRVLILNIGDVFYAIFDLSHIGVIDVPIEENADDMSTVTTKEVPTSLTVEGSAPALPQYHCSKCDTTYASAEEKPKHCGVWSKRVEA